MSLIRTDYVSEWRISAHAQSVLAAGQKHHTRNLTLFSSRRNAWPIFQCNQGNEIFEEIHFVLFFLHFDIGMKEKLQNAPRFEVDFLLREWIHYFLYWIRHGDRGWDRTNFSIDINPINPFVTHPPPDRRLYHTTGVYAPYSLRTAMWVLSRPTRIRTEKELLDGVYGFSSISEKIGMSDHL